MTKFVPKEVLGDSTFVSVYDPESGDTGYARMGDLVDKSETTVTAVTGPGGGIENLVNGERLRDQRSVELMQQEFEFRRAGRVGVGDKAAIAIRFDDGQAAMEATVFPLLKARAIPFSHALISRWQTEYPWGAGVTPAQVTNWVNYGGEIFSHGTDHRDYRGYDGLYEQVVTAKAEIETLLPTVRLQGFSLPGVTIVYTPEERGQSRPYDGLTAPADWYGPTGRLLTSWFPIAEAYSTAQRIPITSQPCRLLYGRSHIGLDSVNLATAIQFTDQAIREKCSLRFMGHPYEFGNPGKMSVADFTTLLDYWVAKRDSGEIDIVMPSSLPYVTNSTYRLDLYNGEGDLIGAGSTPLSGWYNLGGAFNVVSPDGGHDGKPYYQVNASGDYISAPRYLITDVTKQGYNGETFMFEGWAQSAGAGNTTARVDFEAKSGSNIIFALGQSYVVGTSWTRIRFPVTIPNTGSGGEEVTVFNIRCHRYGGDGVRWSDMTAYKL